MFLKNVQIPWPMTVTLNVEAPPELEAVRARLNSIASSGRRFDDIAELVGIREPGPPIRVILAPEKSEWTREVPPWTAGFAAGRSNLVVIFPTRTPSYPHSSLEDVLRHEIAHVLISRAAASHEVPRWFNEGLAMFAERDWRFQDQGRLLLYLLLHPRSSLDAMNRSFAGDEQAQTRAYALAGAFVRRLVQQNGRSMPAQLLARINSGMTFEAAFRDATGTALASEEAEFWQSQRVWSRWVPIITSSAVVWVIVTMIALLALRRKRQRAAEIERAWEEREEGDPES